MRIGLKEGVFTGALGFAGGGALVIWPDDKLIGYILFAAAALLFVWGFRLNGKHLWQGWRRPQVPERHAAILQELAAPLAAVQEQATTYGQCDLGKMASAKAEVEDLISQIPYDWDTVTTVRDFLQACSIVTDTHNTADEMRQAREDVARISPTLFHQLHDGKSVDRRKVDLPDWCRREAPAPAKRNTAKQPPHWTDDKYDEEWAYHANDKPTQRDTPLGEALAFIAYRKWGQEYSQTVVDMFEKNAANYLNDFHQRAYDGKFKVWGKVNAKGVYRQIPSVYWADHHVHAQALLNSYAMAGGHDSLSYGHLMVSRAEFEREFK